MKNHYFLYSLVPVFVACTSTPPEIKPKKNKPEEVQLKKASETDTNMDLASTDEKIQPIKNESKPKVSKNTPNDDRYLIINLRDLNKELAAKQDSAVVNRQQMPEKWVNQYDHDKKWQDMYKTSVSSFLKGWENEFTEHPQSHLPKEELIFAYRKRMEKLFFEQPSFIEYSQKKFTESKELSEFLKKWEANIK